MNNKVSSIIAGPCALESKEQLVRSIIQLKSMGIEYIRACLWKPRTSPGWEGLGFYGLPMLFDETLDKGIIPCTEILTSIHAQMVVDALKVCGKPNAGALVWLGARNQNHFEQRRIAKILAAGPPSLYFMFKNQIWYDKKHWLGIYEHIIETGFPLDRLLGCHRGFFPGYAKNEEGLRNIPEYELAMEMKEKMRIPMYLDPSHIGGSRENVMKIIKESLNYNFDGYLIEVHENVEEAKTDSKQQLTYQGLEEVLQLLKSKKPEFFNPTANF